MSVEKQKIAHSFGQAALTYHAQAALQQDCAAKLLLLLEQWLDQGLDQGLDQWEMPPGKILEIGCGTGFLTQGLVDRFPHHPLQVTDLSAEMLKFCQTHLQIAPNRAAVTFQALDGECLATDEFYSLIVANFVIQWFKQPLTSLQLWLDRLQPGGILCLAFPTCDSFPEWRQVCQTLQIPFTANGLPNAQQLQAELSQIAHESSLQEECFSTTHENFQAFLKSLKAIGAGTNTSGQRLSPPQLKRLMQYWDSLGTGEAALQVDYQVAFLMVRRDA